jgi:DNA-binding transcriptional LysR family regulator
MKNMSERLLELRQLRYFVTLAEELHFARAAERLQMEQSPLSRAIRDMEGCLGVRLFERSTRSTKITRAGTVLLDYARRAIALMEQATTSTRSAALGQSEQLRIGVSDCTAYCRATEVLASFRAANPDVAVSLFEMPLHQQITGIRDGLIDASISLDGRYREGIEATAVAWDPICVVAPAAHSLAHSDAILPVDLVGHPFILFSAESDLGAGYQIDDFVETLVRPRIAFRANSLGTMLILVALGHGIGLVGTTQAMTIARRDVVWRSINDIAPALTTYLLHSTGGISEPLGDFIEFTRETFSKTDSAGALF